MKTCPLCNESFEDDLKFCDLDGTRLTREGGITARDPNKLWSMLGIGLLLGALLISAITVLYMPKAGVALPETTGGIEAVAPSGANDSTPPATTEDSENSDEPGMIAEAATEPGSNKVATPATETSGNAADAAKSAASQTEADSDNQDAASQTEDAPSASTSPKPNEPPAVIKTVSDTKAPEAKPAQPTAESKKNAKPDPSKAKADEKDSDKKKKEDEKKKKGGFFGVFKKIFGKG